MKKIGLLFIFYFLCLIKAQAEGLSGGTVAGAGRLDLPFKDFSQKDTYNITCYLKGGLGLEFTVTPIAHVAHPDFPKMFLNNEPFELQTELSGDVKRENVLRIEGVNFSFQGIEFTNLDKKSPIRVVRCNVLKIKGPLSAETKAEARAAIQEIRQEMQDPSQTASQDMQKATSPAPFHTPDVKSQTGY